MDGDVHITLDQPLRGVAPGQAVVLYLGSRVVGSATIERTQRAA
jgi:tRNA-specific 2-thiouridylase